MSRESVVADARPDDVFLVYIGGPVAFWLPREEVDATIEMLERGKLMTEARALRRACEQYDHDRETATAVELPIAITNPPVRTP